MGVFPQALLSELDRTTAAAVSRRGYMYVLYFMHYNLPHAWQLALSPTRQLPRASAGNRWSVPVGVGVSKHARICWDDLVKFELGFEYSVVSEDAFGQRAMVKLNVTPVIPSLIRKPLFGGGVSQFTRRRTGETTI